jgi:hypothetical protein
VNKKWKYLAIGAVVCLTVFCMIAIRQANETADGVRVPVLADETAVIKKQSDNIAPQTEEAAIVPDQTIHKKEQPKTDTVCLPTAAEDRYSLFADRQSRTRIRMARRQRCVAVSQRYRYRIQKRRTSTHHQGRYGRTSRAVCGRIRCLSKKRRRPLAIRTARRRKHGSRHPY